VHLVGFTIEIYHDARPYERQTSLNLRGIFRRDYNQLYHNFNQEKVIGMLMCYRERNEKYTPAQD